MINTAPNWLQNAIDFLNDKFPEDEDVNVSVLYGYNACQVNDEDYAAYGVYRTDIKSIFIADFEEVKKGFKLSDEETIQFTDKNIHKISLTTLFHEYRHHQQNIYDLDMDEKDADDFAEKMYKEFIS